MHRPVRVLLGAVVLLVGLGAIPAWATGPAGGEGKNPSSPLSVLPVPGAYDQATFTFNTFDENCVAEGSMSIPGVPGFTVDFDNPQSGTIVLGPDTPPGYYDLTYVCDNGDGETTYEGQLAFGYVQVDKVVQGEVPADAQFTIDLTCTVERPDEGYGTEGFPSDLIDTTLTFGAAGGTQNVVHYGSQTCTLTETETAGAISVTVETTDCNEPEAGTEATSGTFDIFSPVACTQTVTNVFRDAAVDDDDVVEGRPPFTG